jgi:hypothetical protein
VVKVRELGKHQHQLEDQVVVELVVQEDQEIHLLLAHHRVIMVEVEQPLLVMEQAVVVELQRQVLMAQAAQEDLAEQEPQHL